MKLFASLKALDAQAAQQYCVPALLLMDAAGKAVADQAKALTASQEATMVLLAGPGNNGGDAFACARWLWSYGYRQLRVLALTEPPADSAAGQQWAMVRRLGIPQIDIDQLETVLPNSQLIIDGLYGSGLNRPIDGLGRQIITLCQQYVKIHGIRVIAIDMPSGVDSLTGQIHGCALPADMTVTLAASKPGLHLYPGKALAGTVTVASIGVPPDLLTQAEPDAWLLNAACNKANLPPRSVDGHKYTFGHVLVIAGSPQYAGAAALTSQAALTAGAGLVTLASPAFHPALPPEIIQLPLANPVTVDCVTRLTPLLTSGKIAAVVMGPGLGQEAGPFIKAVLNHLIHAYTGPVVLDADALTVWAMDRQPLSNRFCLTPHTGEATRLLPGLPVDNPLRAAAALAETTQAQVVLKTAVNVVRLASTQTTYISAFGNHGMATAGSGDVLAGLIGGLAAQMPLEQAMLAGVGLHGLAGDKAAEALTPWCLTASSLLTYLPESIKTILQP